MTERELLASIAHFPEVSSKSMVGPIKGIPVRLGLDLPGGRFSLRIAVHDLGARGAGSMEVPVMIGK
jgi:hypothetical protein